MEKEILNELKEIKKLLQAIVSNQEQFDVNIVNNVDEPNTLTETILSIIDSIDEKVVVKKEQRL